MLTAAHEYDEAQLGMKMATTLASQDGDDDFLLGKMYSLGELCTYVSFLKEV